MPDLLPLLHLPNLPGLYLFSDGRIVRASGFSTAMLLLRKERLGFARRIPYGIDIQTDAQKFWFLGRNHFAPFLTAEIMAAHARDPLYDPATD